MKISLTRFCVPSTCRFKGTEDVQNRIGFNRLRGDAVNSLRKITFFKRKRIKEILVHSGPVHSKLDVGIDSGFHD